MDAEHRLATGRPISRDTLRSRLRIGRDRAAQLVTTVRAEQSAGREADPAPPGGDPTGTDEAQQADPARIRVNA